MGTGTTIGNTTIAITTIITAAIVDNAAKHRRICG
jgi:hypothetical protein